MTKDSEDRLGRLEQIVEAAVKAKDWKDVDGFRVALRELREIGSPTAVDFLARMLEGKSRSIKIRVLDTLWRINDPRALSLLKQTLETSENEGIRRMAARGLIRTRGADALDLVAKAHREGRILWDTFMVKYITELEGEEFRVFDILVELLQSDKMYAWGSAIWGLGALGDRRAIPIIEELMRSRTLLKTGDWYTHYSAADALIKLGVQIPKERRQTLFPRHGELAPQDGVTVYQGENLPEEALVAISAGETFQFRALWSEERMHEACHECRECWEKEEYFDPPTFDSAAGPTNTLELLFVVLASAEAEATSKAQKAAHAYLNQRYCLRPLQAPKIEQVTNMTASDVLQLLRGTKCYLVM